MEKYLTRIEKLGKMKYHPNVKGKKNASNLAQKALNTKQFVSVAVGPNYVHDILDSLKSKH